MLEHKLSYVWAIGVIPLVDAYDDSVMQWGFVSEISCCIAAVSMFTLHLYVVVFFSNFLPRYTVDFLSISFTWIAVAKFTAMYCVTSLHCSHALSLLFCYDVISQYDLLCILHVLTRLNGFQFYEIVVFPVEVFCALNLSLNCL